MAGGSLGKTLLAFALLHSILPGKICLLLQVFLDFLLLHSHPQMIWGARNLPQAALLKLLILYT